MEKKTEEKKKYEGPEKEGLAAVLAEPDLDKQKERCVKEINKVLQEHDGLESNIGIGSKYWDLVAYYRKITAAP